LPKRSIMSFDRLRADNSRLLIYAPAGDTSHSTGIACGDVLSVGGDDW
jgi:hypothetical protein